MNKFKVAKFINAVSQGFSNIGLIKMQQNTKCKNQIKIQFFPSKKFFLVIHSSILCINTAQTSSKQVFLAPNRGKSNLEFWYEQKFFKKWKFFSGEWRAYLACGIFFGTSLIFHDFLGEDAAQFQTSSFKTACCCSTDHDRLDLVLLIRT